MLLFFLQEAEAHVNQLNLLEKMELFSRSSYMFAESDQDANQRTPGVDTKDEEQKNVSHTEESQLNFLVHTHNITPPYTYTQLTLHTDPEVTVLV